VLIRALVLSGPSEAGGWSVGCYLLLLPSCSCCRYCETFAAAANITAGGQTYIHYIVFRGKNVAVVGSSATPIPVWTLYIT
jgi:hypothetical protein